MLKSAIALGLVVSGYAQTTEVPNPFASCWDFMEPQKTVIMDNTTLINYVNYEVSGFILPLALDECTSTSLVSSAEGADIFSCSEDGMTMTKQHYANADCSTMDGEPESWMMSDYGELAMRDEYYFECDGETYAVSSDVSISACDANPSFVTLHAAVSACAGNSEYDVNAWCDEDELRIQFFVPGTSCQDPWLCRGNDTSNMCAPWFDTSSGRIYGNLIHCNRPGNRASTESGDSSEEDSAFGLTAVLASIVGLMIAALY